MNKLRVSKTNRNEKGINDRSKIALVFKCKNITHFKGSRMNQFLALNWSHIFEE